MRRITLKSRCEEVARHVSALIERGTFRPGAKLPSERELAGKLRVSRPTVREALAVLEARGLVDVRRGAGAYVTSSRRSPEAGAGNNVRALELIEARCLFEAEVAAYASLVITEESLDKLKNLVCALERPLDSRMREQHCRDFHVLIARATRNPAMALVVETLWDVQMTSVGCREFATELNPADVRFAVEDRRHILEALHARSPVRVRAALHSHMDHLCQLVMNSTVMNEVVRTRLEVEARKGELVHAA
jgi:DNA-binding FadR family transcriptional regulator